MEPVRVTDLQQIEIFWITTMPECNIFKIFIHA
jgi:hypothetical protein